MDLRHATLVSASECGPQLVGVENEGTSMDKTTEEQNEKTCCKCDCFLGGEKWESLDQLISNPDVVGLESAIAAKGVGRNARISEILQSDNDDCLRIAYMPIPRDETCRQVGAEEEILVPQIGIRRYGGDFEFQRKLSEEDEEAIVSYLKELGFQEDSKPNEFENLRCFSLNKKEAIADDGCPSCALAQ